MDNKSAVREFALAPVAGTSLKLMWALVAALPLLITLVALLLAFAAPGPKKLIGGDEDLTLLVTLGLVEAVSLPLAWWLHRSMVGAKVTLGGGVLELHCGFYRQRIPATQLQVENARVLNLDEHPEWRPGLKTNGIGLPGFAAGHFRLRNLKRKAFCLLTRRQQVLVLPETSGRVLLLSLAQPQQLLQALSART